MPTFILSLNWTEQGIRSVKDSPKRAQAARDLGKKLGVEIKQVFLTSGESDLLLVVDAADGDSIAKFALALFHGSEFLGATVVPPSLGGALRARSGGGCMSPAPLTGHRFGNTSQRSAAFLPAVGAG